MLDKSLFGLFGRCFSVNQVLGKGGSFLRFFERRNLYRHLLKKKTEGKNEPMRELPTCVIRKFNGYEMLKKDLEKKERTHHDPIDIVYEPTFDPNTPVFCYFCPEIQKAYRAYIERSQKVTRYISSMTVRQCHHCKFFLENLKKE